MQRSWMIVIVAAAALGVVAGCSSSAHSSTSPSSPPSGAGARKELRQVGQCLDKHGADASSLTGVLTGGSVAVTASQLTTLRTASVACESSVPESVHQLLVPTVTCLNGHGYHLDGSKPLSALFSLDLTDSGVLAAVKGCTAALPTRSRS